MSEAVATRPSSQTGRRSQVESFFRTLILGDFEDHPNAPAEIVGGLISLIPILDQLMDVRDIAGCLYKINAQGGFKYATSDQVVNLGFAALGAIPEIGSAFKTAFKPLWRERHLARTAVNSGVDAIEVLLGMRKGGAMQWIRKELLGKWGPRTQQAIAQINMAMDACIGMLDFLANASGWKDYLVPDSIQDLARGMLPGMKGMRADVSVTMNRASAEIEMFLSDLLGEQAARIAMDAGQKAVAASARPGARSNSRNAHNAAAEKPRGEELPREGRKRTGGRDTADTKKGAGSVHASRQTLRGAFGKAAHMATGLVGEHMVDYHELERLGGSFPHDANASFLKTASVAKINADKRPVNLSLMDLPKMPHKGIDAVWAHGDKFTVTEAKARGSIHAVMAMANGPRVPKTISGLDGRLLYTLLSTSKSEEGDGKPVIQMSEDWVASRASKEDLGPGPERVITLGHCDRRVVLVTLEAKGASDHVQALAEIRLECDPELANSHTSHGRIKEWGKSDIDRVAAARQKHEIDRSAKRSGASAGAKPGGSKRDAG